MKKCPYCGREYPDDVALCVTDGEKLNRIAGSGPSKSAETAPVQGFVPLEETEKSPRSRANRDMVVGAIWCGVGVLITVVTYSAASGPEGGSYLLMWGPIIFGGIQFMRGLLSR